MTSSDTGPHHVALPAEKALGLKTSEAVSTAILPRPPKRGHIKGRDITASLYDHWP
jgi:hypothetical protein